MANVHTFAWFPDEHEEFVRYLERSEIWARGSGGPGKSVPSRAAPVAEFFSRAFERGESVYLGSRAVILDPPLSECERVEGGTEPPVTQAGKVVPGVANIVGGTKVKFNVVSIMDAELLDYRPGVMVGSAELSQSSLYYYSGSFRGGQYLTKSDEFLTWAKRVVAWVRRRAKAAVPLSRCNYSSPCTERVAKAHECGLVVTY
jgi:hypothetical protein